LIISDLREGIPQTPGNPISGRAPGTSGHKKTAAYKAPEEYSEVVLGRKGLRTCHIAYFRFLDFARNDKLSQ